MVQRRFTTVEEDLRLETSHGSRRNSPCRSQLLIWVQKQWPWPGFRAIEPQNHSITFQCQKMRKAVQGCSRGPNDGFGCECNEDFKIKAKHEQIGGKNKLKVKTASIHKSQKSDYLQRSQKNTWKIFKWRYSSWSTFQGSPIEWWRFLLRTHFSSQFSVLW